MPEMIEILENTIPDRAFTITVSVTPRDFAKLVRLTRILHLSRSEVYRQAIDLLLAQHVSDAGNEKSNT